LKTIFFVALSFQPNPSIKMGGTDRCGILFYAGTKIFSSKLKKTSTATLAL
jgi:hypothetical protein